MDVDLSKGTPVSIGMQGSGIITWEAARWVCNSTDSQISIPRSLKQGWFLNIIKGYMDDALISLYECW